MSLNITKKTGDTTTLVLEGRLDTTTAPELEKVLDEVIPGVKELIFDCTDLEYISSAGLRVILKAQKSIANKGIMKLVHVQEIVKEVFEITGFTDFLNIED